MSVDIRVKEHPLRTLATIRPNFESLVVVLEYSDYVLGFLRLRQVKRPRTA